MVGVRSRAERRRVASKDKANDMVALPTKPVFLADKYNATADSLESLLEYEFAKNRQ
jgi:hypothetical protein